MFGSKKDPLVDVVKKVMEGNEVRRQVERDLNSELGIYSKQVLPNEYHSRYDSVLSEKTKIALNEQLKGGDPNRGTVFTGGLTDVKTGKPVMSDMAAKATPPAGPRYSPADKEALDQKFKDAATSTPKPTPAPTSTPADKSAPTPAKPMSDKEALDQKFKDAAAGIDEALTGKGKLGSMYQGYRRKAREASTQDETDENNRKATEAVRKISYLTAKKAVDTELKKYGKKRSQKMPYKGPKYKAMDEESLDEVSRDRATTAAQGFADRADKAIKNKDYPKYTKNERARELAVKKVYGRAKVNAVPRMSEESLDEIFNTKEGEATRKRYIKGAESELDRDSALMKDVKKGDKRAIARMQSREDGVFNAQRRKKLSEEDNLDEMAPKGDKYERMIRHIKAKYSKDGLTDDEKSIAYATAQKVKNKDSK
jgi:hypothetical protein